MKCGRVGCEREVVRKKSNQRFCCQRCWLRHRSEVSRARYAALRNAGYDWRDANSGRHSQAEFETMLSVPA